MLQRQSLEIFFNLGGNGLVDGGSSTYLTVTGVVDNTNNTLNYDLVGKFATLEIEIYDVANFQASTLSGTVSGNLNFQLSDISTILNGAIPAQQLGTFSFSNGVTDLVDIMIVDQYGYSNVGLPPTSYFVMGGVSYQGELDFRVVDTSTILNGALPAQQAGMFNFANGVTDQVDIMVVDQYGYSNIVIPTQYYSAANIEGATASSAMMQIGYLPIMGGATWINPVNDQPIYQSYGSYGKSTEFTITAVNAQGSTFGVTPSVYLQSGSSTITADVSFNINLGAVNDGTSIFGTYVVPKVYTYPDGSTIPSQKQTWTI